MRSRLFGFSPTFSLFAGCFLVFSGIAPAQAQSQPSAAPTSQPSAAPTARQITADLDVAPPAKPDDTGTPEPAKTSVPVAESAPVPPAAGDPSASSSSAPVAPVRARPDPGPNVVRTVSYVMLAVAGAGVVAVGVFGSLSLNAKADFDSMAASGTATTKQLIDKADEAERNALVTDICLIPTVPAAAAAVALLIVGSRHTLPPGAGKKQRAQATTFEPPFVLPYATPSGAGATLQLAF